MKRLTYQAEVDLRYLLEAAQQLRDPLFTTESASLREAKTRLLNDLGINCESQKEFSGFRLLEIITLLRDLFKSQFESLSLIAKTDLTRHQIDYLNRRIAEHAHENGSLRAWRHNFDASCLYAACNQNRELIGVLYIFVSPTEAPIAPNTADVAWWIDDLWKGERLAYPMLDACAKECKSKGAIRLGNLLIEDGVERRSHGLERYLHQHFEC